MVVRSKRVLAILALIVTLITLVASLFLIQTFNLNTIEQPNSDTLGQPYDQILDDSDLRVYDQEKVLSALKNIVGVDVDKYTVNVTHYNFEPDPRFEEETDQYKYVRDIILNLDVEESQLDVSASFSKSDDKLLSMTLYVLSGRSRSSVYYVNRLSAEPLVATMEFLYRLEAFNGDSIIKDMQNIVKPTENLGALNKTVGNIKCKVMTYSEQISNHPTIGTFVSPRETIYFLQLFNGIESMNGISVEFVDGFFEHFGDSWDFHSVGSVEVKVSREQAITIAQNDAINEAGSASLTFPSDRPAIAELTMRSIDRSFDALLYPFWSVTLTLTYPPDPWIGGWHVWIRADTGEVISHSPIHSHPDLYPVIN